MARVADDAGYRRRRSRHLNSKAHAKHTLSAIATTQHHRYTVDPDPLLLLTNAYSLA